MTFAKQRYVGTVLELLLSAANVKEIYVVNIEYISTIRRFTVPIVARSKKTINLFGGAEADGKDKYFIII